ncbi:amidohydrolase [Alkaliphilus sp. MSJ-5]|uniref:Peptidase M20 domain-containing protein 2 n=1 Tax=Alkaliphilus flagellatus TaxID=2841507 RepID=A0ABS6G1T4_9FIRM|nr:amidohydrolase [Alkaliphilus flagellatus]MBU5676446.1 amidohydrolase [Alkaliphilus flagellatus]
MDKDQLKKQVVETIDSNREKIIKIGKKIYSSPEYGYKEFESTKAVVEFMKNELKLDVEENIAITGCRAEVNSHKSGPRIAILAELDAISCIDHKDANEIGATHACGHNIQIAGMLGAAVGLILSGAIDSLDGKIEFIATPAEEFIELEYRDKLRKDEKIKYFGGKQELIYRGYFDNVDISMMFHALDMGDNKALVGPVSNGFIGKKINFIGKESHAGSAPEEGINALNAAMLALNNVHAQRETFKESDKVRFHPIITKGGDIVNVVPADVKMESYVRARTINGMLDANSKVNRALIAGASAVGAQIEITEIPGYLPILRYKELDRLFKDNLVNIGINEEQVLDGGDFTGSFDFGDVSQLMPTLHPMIGGIKGSLHSREYEIIDEELAYIVPAKAMALTVVDLLFNNASIGNSILENFTPKMTKEEYLEFMESVSKVIKA